MNSCVCISLTSRHSRQQSHACSRRGWNPLSSIRTGQATGAVTYRDPDGREVVFAPFVFGVNEPDDSSASGKHEFPSE